VKKILGLFLVTSLLAVGCAGGRQAPRSDVRGTTAATYYPLAVGNRWTYEVGLLGETTLQEVRIVDREGALFVDSQGGRLTVDAFGVRDQKRYLLREPVAAGNSWTNVVSVSSIERYRILDQGGPCEVPAGRFEDCVRVEGRNRVDADTTLVNELTFARGVGLVEVQTAAEHKGRRVPQARLVLRSFELQPHDTDSQ
jgi:hypothetical protein